MMKNRSTPILHDTIYSDYQTTNMWLQIYCSCYATVRYPIYLFFSVFDSSVNFSLSVQHLSAQQHTYLPEMKIWLYAILLSIVVIILYHEI